MHSPGDKKLNGINVWFVIEIISFYGYILSAMLFILITQIESALGYSAKAKEHMPDRYKYDFLQYHEKDLDWMAFVFILWQQ